VTLARGKVLKGADAARAVRPASPEGAIPEGARGRVIPGRVMDARAEAERILTGAQAEADAVVREAETRARAHAAAAVQAARDEAVAGLAAAHLALRAREEGRAARELDRTVEIAVLLAERILGEALGVDRSRIAALALEALGETRGARRVHVEAAPEDVQALEDALRALGHEVAVVMPNAELGRGSLLVETELGRIDARLAPRLERLATAIREALAAEADEASNRTGRPGIGDPR
jgi:flagellar biosynthesis/type III secretory pathway protein FliH